MCQQSVGLLQRVCDNRGLATVSLTLVRELTELGNPVPVSPTGFAWANLGNSDDCMGWSSSDPGVKGWGGNPRQVTPPWLVGIHNTCDNLYSLYCLEVGPGGGPNKLPSLPPTGTCPIWRAV